MSAETLYPADATCEPTFRDMKIGHKHRWVVFSLKNNQHTVSHTQPADAKKTVDEMAATLPQSECRYVVFEHMYTSADGRPQDRLYFISWLPRNATAPEKMMYTTARASLRAVTPGCHDIIASTKVEVIDGINGKKTVSKDEDEASDAGDDWMDE